MRFNQYITENKSISFRDEMVGVQSGQSDIRLSAYMGNKRVGYIDYTDYQGEISIKFIEVYAKRQGIGKQLILQLQKQYPKTEIDWGMLTGDGAKLFKSIKNKLYVDRARLRKIDKLKKELKKLKGIEQKAIKTNDWANWDNDVYDRMEDVKQELKIYEQI
jgi:hypothetical protein